MMCCAQALAILSIVKLTLYYKTQINFNLFLFVELIPLGMSFGVVKLTDFF